MTRRDRAREVLARAYEAAGYGDEATAFRAGMWTCHDHPALAAMLAFADAELERASTKCEDYSEVNFEQTGDSILLDPCLRGRGFTPENIAESERQQINGCVHASQAHAGLHLAELIRAMKEE